MTDPDITQFYPPVLDEAQVSLLLILGGIGIVWLLGSLWEEWGEYWTWRVKSWLSSGSYDGKKEWE